MLVLESQVSYLKMCVKMNWCGLSRETESMCLLSDREGLKNRMAIHTIQQLFLQALYFQLKLCHQGMLVTHYLFITATE